MVVVTTLFGIVAKAVRRNKDVDKLMCSVEIGLDKCPFN